MALGALFQKKSAEVILSNVFLKKGEEWRK